MTQPYICLHLTLTTIRLTNVESYPLFPRSTKSCLSEFSIDSLRCNQDWSRSLILNAWNTWSGVTDAGGKKKSCRPTWSLSRMYGGLSATPFDKFFATSLSTNTRGHTHTAKIQKARCNLDVRRFFFSERVIDKWNRLQQEDIDVKTVN